MRHSTALPTPKIKASAPPWLYPCKAPRLGRLTVMWAKLILQTHRPSATTISEALPSRSPSASSRSAFGDCQEREGRPHLDVQEVKYYALDVLQCCHAKTTGPGGVVQRSVVAAGWHNIKIQAAICSLHSVHSITRPENLVPPFRCDVWHV